MSEHTPVTLARKGSARRIVLAGELEIPDLWHIAMKLDEPAQAAVLKVWHLCHDLKQHIIETE